MRSKSEQLARYLRTDRQMLTSVLVFLRRNQVAKLPGSCFNTYFPNAGSTFSYIPVRMYDDPVVQIVKKTLANNNRNATNGLRNNN